MHSYSSNSSPIESHLRDFPRTRQYFGLDRFIDPTTGKVPLLRSTHKWSNAERINTFLTSLHREHWAHAYIRNRVREHAATIVLQSIFGWNFWLSTIENDILYSTDIVGEIWGQYFAIDLTQNSYRIEKKVDQSNGDGSIYLVGPGKDIITLPFIVFYIHTHLLEAFREQMEIILSENHAPSRKNLITRTRLQLKTLLMVWYHQELIEKYIFPHMKGGVSISNEVQKIFREAIEKLMDEPVSSSIWG